MPLERVRIEGFRCLTAVDVELHPERNYLFGRNGAGKTSFLEAIYLLGRGRSFRTRQNRRLIQHGSSGFSVYGEYLTATGRRRLGVALDGSGLQVRLDGESARGMSALATVLPVHVIEPTMHRLIEGGPSERRRFLDWGVFHVEPSYLDHWRRYRRILGQRNAALKQGQDLSVWLTPLLEVANLVDSARGRYADALNVALTGLGDALLGNSINIDYRNGWSEGTSLEQALLASDKKDRSFGLTHVGPHRADLRVNLGARGVREEISRGQQKLVAASLILAQIRVFAKTHGEGGVLLVDDPAAELDQSALGALLAALDDLPAQLILTGLSEVSLAPEKAAPVFAIEQGRVSQML
ncbi:MAG: DNA replication/repair protein RecF [Gammaproteobacteria bacterium]